MHGARYIEIEDHDPHRAGQPQHHGVPAAIADVAGVAEARARRGCTGSGACPRVTRCKRCRIWRVADGEAALDAGSRMRSEMSSRSRARAWLRRPVSGAVCNSRAIAGSAMFTPVMSIPTMKRLVQQTARIPILRRWVSSSIATAAGSAARSLVGICLRLPSKFMAVGNACVWSVADPAAMPSAGVGVLHVRFEIAPGSAEATGDSVPLACGQRLLGRGCCERRGGGRGGWPVLI